MDNLEKNYEKTVDRVAGVPAMIMTAIVLNFFMFRAFRRNDAVWE